MEDAQTRIAEVEEWQADSGTLMWEMSERTRWLEEKLMDLGGRSQRKKPAYLWSPGRLRKGLRVVEQIVEHLLITELRLPEGFELHIQRRHRALVKKQRGGSELQAGETECRQLGK